MVACLGFLFGFQTLIKTTMDFWLDVFFYFVGGCWDLIVVSKFLIAQEQSPTGKILRRFRNHPLAESWIVCVFYFIGGCLFFAGSVLFVVPGTGSKGTLTFRAGSCFYTCGSLSGLVRALQSPYQGEGVSTPYFSSLALSILVKVSYIIASSCFVTGGIFAYEYKNGTMGGWLWFVGSDFFCVGGTLAVLEFFVNWKRKIEGEREQERSMNERSPLVGYN
eukprot:TRINITY_DN12157_c0_g1_i1.p1 TRINITY_DN12157_c0_g1~~TRINITY_DN12157_c0_g1_i1.p1  ORF type:complete len:220 (+),score=33.78 TRINITY_DN12157_c0_g1_i1:162-821(+)